MFVRISLTLSRVVNLLAPIHLKITKNRKKAGRLGYETSSKIRCRCKSIHWSTHVHNEERVVN